VASSSAAASYFAVLLLLLQQRLRAYLHADHPEQCRVIAAQLRATTGRSHEAFLFSQLFLSGLRGHSPAAGAVFRRLMQVGGWSRAARQEGALQGALLQVQGITSLLKSEMQTFASLYDA
jgi:hypothetical protein